MLLEKLLEIERAIKRGDIPAAYALIMDAEDCALQVERELLKLRESKSARLIEPPTQDQSRRHRKSKRGAT
jgi:hypothetical protein